MDEDRLSPRKRVLNHNVKLSLWWTLLETGSQSIRSGDILSAYVYLSTDSNSQVGYIQGVNGVMQMLAALPAGWAADRYRRDTMLRASAIVGVIGGGCLAAALALHGGMWAILGSMAILGCYRGLYTPASEAIFSDSVPTGRTSIYTTKYIMTQFASIVGPLLSVVMFLFLGNKWQIADCRIVVLAGLCLMAFPLISMCFFDDDKTLGSRSEAVTPSPSMARIRSIASFGNLHFRGLQDDDEMPPGCLGSCMTWCTASVLIPTLIVFSDFIGALASGMTLKFFSLFFMQRIGLAPVDVSLLGVLGPLAISFASKAAERLAKWSGRVQLTLSTRLGDIALLIVMAYLPTNIPWAKDVIVAVHIVRMALANCSRPLLRSVLMDHVPKRHRARVSALDAVRTCSWSGSAVLGGILIEKYDFQVTFLITAAVKALSFAPLLCLLCLLDDEPQKAGRAPDPYLDGLNAALLSPEEGSADEDEDAESGESSPPALPKRLAHVRGKAVDWQAPEIHVVEAASGETTPRADDSGESSPAGWPPSPSCDQRSESGSVLPPRGPLGGHKSP